MIRSSKAIAAAALLFVMPTVASALGISIVNVSGSGASTSVLQQGDTITFDLRLENGTRTALQALDIVVTGFDTPGTTNLISSRLNLVDAQTEVASSAFNSVVDPEDGSLLGGLPNNIPTARQLWAQNLLNPQPVRTLLFAGASLSPATGTGAIDLGVDGSSIGSGDVHFRVTYQLGNLRGLSQNLVLSFGVAPEIGHDAFNPVGDAVPFQNATYALTVIPEPGTALLMGLGLAALATRRR